jgi:hypothetical protein
MTETNASIQHRSRNPSTGRSFQHTRYQRQNASPSQSFGASGNTVDVTVPCQRQEKMSVVATSDDQPCPSSAPTQTPIGQAPRSFLQRKPYSEALVGATAKHDQSATDALPSSSLATQVELSSSSANGDQPVRKCGVTDAVQVPATATPRYAEDGISLYIAK